MQELGMDRHSPTELSADDPEAKRFDHASLQDDGRTVHTRSTDVMPAPTIYRGIVPARNITRRDFAINGAVVRVVLNPLLCLLLLSHLRIPHWSTYHCSHHRSLRTTATRAKATGATAPSLDAFAILIQLPAPGAASVRRPFLPRPVLGRPGGSPASEKPPTRKLPRPMLQDALAGD